jgi:putative transposase
MTRRRSRYLRHRFPPEIISHAVWLYYRFNLSFREVEDMLAERSIVVSYEAIRQWCRKFGPDCARQLKRRQGRLGDTWYLDELFVTINGERHYLWRAVDHDGDVIDILVQSLRDGAAARQFFRKLLKSQRLEPQRLVTDKLGSYWVAHRDMMPSVTHDAHRYANNRAGDIAPVNPPTGAPNATLQIARSGSAISACSRRRSKSISTQSAPAKVSSPPTVTETVFHHMGNCDSGLIWI